jgi:hypothetical protein
LRYSLQPLFFALVNHWLIFDLLKNNQKYPLVFNNEYRVWQGSDFDINAELAEQEVQLCTLNVADKLNETSVFLPFVAKKYSIEKHKCAQLHFLLG